MGSEMCIRDSFIIWDPGFVGAAGKTVKAPFIICYGKIFQDIHARAGTLCGVLIDAADTSVADIVFLVGDVGAVDENLAAVGEDCAADQIEQRSLSGSVAANDGDELIVRDGEIKIPVENLFVDRAGIICLADVFKLQHFSSPWPFFPC